MTNSALQLNLYNTTHRCNWWIHFKLFRPMYSTGPDPQFNSISLTWHCATNVH